jgi:hypothetical protein
MVGGIVQLAHLPVEPLVLCCQLRRDEGDVARGVAGTEIVVLGGVGRIMLDLRWIVFVGNGHDLAAGVLHCGDGVGLPRATYGPHENFRDTFRRPDVFLEVLKSFPPADFEALLSSMTWPQIGPDAGQYDRWEPPYTTLVHSWVESQGGATPPPLTLDEAMLRLLQNRRDEARLRHGGINAGGVNQ